MGSTDDSPAARRKATLREIAVAIGREEWERVRALLLVLDSQIPGRRRPWER